jgi:hypothetical protein
MISAYFTAKSISNCVGECAAGQGRVQRLLLRGREMLGSYPAKHTTIHFFGREPNCVDKVIG